AVAAPVAGADVRILLLRERGGGGVGATIRGLVHRMAGMPLDPLELDAATGERAIDVLEQIDVQHGLAVLLAPALALPSRHPLRDRVDHVLAVAQDQQVLVGVLGGGLEQVEHGLQLAHVVGAVGQPPARQVSSSMYQAQPAGPGLPRAEPSAAAVMLMGSMLPQRAGWSGQGPAWPGRTQRATVMPAVVGGRPIALIASGSC